MGRNWPPFKLLVWNPPGKLAAVSPQSAGTVRRAWVTGKRLPMTLLAFPFSTLTTFCIPPSAT